MPQLVACYEQAERDIRDGFDLIARAERRLNEAFTMNSFHTIRVGDHHQRMNFADVESAVREARRGVWETLIERLELRRIMSIKEWEKLSNEVHKGHDVPDVTEENVRAMARQFRDQLPAMLQAAVIEVFEWLTPQAQWHAYKTNSRFEIGRKVVLSYALDTWQGKVNGAWKLSYSRAQHFNALENVFSSLDGKGSITKTHFSEIAEALRQIPAGAPCVGETPYFSFRGFLNGNLHLTFRRPDLLRKFNAIAGGRRLRPEGAP